MTTESYTGIDTTAQCQAAFRRDSVAEREAGRLLTAGRKLADELDRRDVQLAEALALLNEVHPTIGAESLFAINLRAILTRHLREQADELRQLAYAKYRRSDNVILRAGDYAALNRVATLREEGDALIAQADRLDPDPLNPPAVRKA